MEILSQFTIYLTLLLIFLIVILLAMAGFCAVMRQIDKRKKLSPRVMKWVEVLDWLKEEKDDN